MQHAGQCGGGFLKGSDIPAGVQAAWQMQASVLSQEVLQGLRLPSAAAHQRASAKGCHMHLWHACRVARSKANMGHITYSRALCSIQHVARCS